jgi:hypothetical protein
MRQAHPVVMTAPCLSPRMSCASSSCATADMLLAAPSNVQACLIKVTQSNILCPSSRVPTGAWPDSQAGSNTDHQGPTHSTPRAQPSTELLISAKVFLQALVWVSSN